LFTAFLLIRLGSILKKPAWSARGVLALLLLFSVISWDSILQKLGLFGRIRRESDQFLRIFAPTAASRIRSARASGSPFALRLRRWISRVAKSGGNSTPAPKTAALKSLQAVP